jgi:hypothetical protein
MVQFSRVANSDLLIILSEWDSSITKKVLVVACGGTALTLNGYKPSTKDIDFLVPRFDEYDHLMDVLTTKLSYKDTDVGFRDPSGVYRFDLYRGNVVFQTELLDPVDRPDRHKVIHAHHRLTVGVLNPYDLIISKMFRGDDVDVQDSITMMKSEVLDLRYLGERYIETAAYYYNEPSCKRKLGYLIASMLEQSIDCVILQEMMQSWNPL